MTEWLNDTWQRINQARLQARLPHALLISGPTGVGKHVLAERLTSALLCEQADAAGRACGRCPACGWLRAGTHPDLIGVQPDENGKAIKVDQVRALCKELGMTSHGGRYKVAVIQPAEAMNVNAANSLLKTLEEPTDATLLILLSALPGRLAATIRSRCQQLQLGPPEESAALHWLQSKGIAQAQARRCLRLADGAPLRARELAESDAGPARERCLDQLQQVFGGQLDPLQAAKDWLGELQRQNLEWWLVWLKELIRWRQAGRRPIEPEVAQKLQPIVEAVDCRQLFDLADRVAIALNNQGTGLNQQLMLEDLLISWANLTQPIPRRTMAGNR